MKKDTCHFSAAKKAMQATSAAELEAEFYSTEQIIQEDKQPNDYAKKKKTNATGGTHTGNSAK